MKSPRIDPNTVRRILICQLRQIGDVLLATPSARLLKRAFPQAEVHVFTEKKCAPVLANNPDVDVIWAVDRSKLTNLFKEIAFYRKVAAQDFDILVDFQQLPRCRWVTAFSRARVRLTYPPPWYNRWLYTHWRVQDQGYSAMAKASLLTLLGITWQGEKPRMVLTPAEQAQAMLTLQDLGLEPGHHLVTVDATHRRPSRQWPLPHMARLLELAAQARPDLRFLLLHGPGEQEHVQQLLNMTAAAPVCLLPADMLSLRQAAAVIEQADLHLGNCSGPRHMAVAVGTPSLVALGATSQSWTYPGPGHQALAMNLDCQPCNQNTCRLGDPPPCLDALAPETVLDALLPMLTTYGRTSGFTSPRTQDAKKALNGI